MNFFGIALSLVIIHCSYYAEANNEGLVVDTLHGPVRGTTRHANGAQRPVYSFFGIPYARSPDYSFRFHYPVDPWKWSSVKNVTNERVPFCYQDRKALKAMNNNAPFKAFIDDDAEMKEDCLTVNVFTPELPLKNSNANNKKGIPVIVWIHGGSLQKTASASQLWALSAYEDVVLVSVQYRLGVFGFLSFDEKWAPSNSGLHDQVKALEWVRDNIAAFGGNPNLVTVFGLSAGGISASAHAVSPLTKGLIHRVIAGSAVVNMPQRWDDMQNEKALKISETLGCSFNNDIPPTSTCLRNRVTSHQIVDAARQHDIMFKPVLDGYFFPSSADKLLDGLSPSVPVLVGVVSGEFDYILSRMSFEKYLGPAMNKTIAKSIIVDNLIQYYPDTKGNSQVLEEILSFYLNDSSSWKSLLFGVLEFMTDSLFHVSATEFAARAKAAGASAYFYNFSPKPSFYQNKVLNLERAYDFNRADHSDDLPFFFGFPFLNEFHEKGLSFTPEEKLLSRRMMRILSTFAKSGKPSTDDVLQWPQYPSYVDLNQTFRVKNKFRQKQMSLWQRLLKPTRTPEQKLDNKLTENITPTSDT